MRDYSDDNVSPYLNRPTVSLGQACRGAGRDKCSESCPDCGLHDLCEKTALIHTPRAACAIQR